MAGGADRQFLDFLAAPRLGSKAGSTTVRRALEALRAHFAMDVAYVSEFVGNESVFRAVDAPGLEALIKVGDSRSLDDVYCRHILAGRLPEVIADTANEPVAMAMPITAAVPIGAHISVPIVLPDGRVYGMLCCLSFQAKHTLNERDLKMMRVFADVIAFEINREIEARKAIEEKAARIRRVIDSNRVSILFQPILNIKNHSLIGLECLSRFNVRPSRPPDVWFAEAAEVGLGTELELAAINRALRALRSIAPDIYLSINVSPQVMLSQEFPAAFDGTPLERIVIEMTEHVLVADYDGLLAAIAPLRERGVRLAVDDAGAGYATLRHILLLQPDVIKLDMLLTRNIDTDPARQALTDALVSFSRTTGSRIVAEGVETEDELNMLSKLGIDAAQGFHLARPMPLANAVKLFRRRAARRAASARPARASDPTPRRPPQTSGASRRARPDAR